MTDWIKHDGGPCPVAPETMVDVKTNDGRDMSRCAGWFEWKHVGGYGDIIAYRIAKEPKT